MVTDPWAGSTTNPYGVKGLENCHFLKTIEDAREIRNRVLQNLEHACLPTTSDEERRRLLSFVVSGGGPTGVEFAAELFDLLNEDLGRSFPKILRNEISVHVIQSRGHILNTYDEAVSRFAEARFAHDQVEVLTNSRVKEVQPDKILFTQKNDQGETVTKEIPMGFCLWSTGVGKLKTLCSLQIQIFTVNQLKPTFANASRKSLIFKQTNTLLKRTLISVSMELLWARSMLLVTALPFKTMLQTTSSISSAPLPTTEVKTRRK